MYIKTQSVIPTNIKITKCPPREGRGRSVFSLLRAEEKKLEQKADFQRFANKVSAAIKVGYSVNEAIILCKE